MMEMNLMIATRKISEDKFIIIFKANIVSNILYIFAMLTFFLYLAWISFPSWGNKNIYLKNKKIKKPKVSYTAL